MSETKSFPLGAILSITDGKLVAPIGDVHELLDWMTGEPLMTHQLPRASDECRPFLLAQFPGIGEVEVPAGTDSWEKVEAFLKTVMFPSVLQVQPIPRESHTSIDPISELRMMRPDMPIIAISTEDHE